MVPTRGCRAPRGRIQSYGQWISYASERFCVSETWLATRPYNLQIATLSIFRWTNKLLTRDPVPIDALAVISPVINLHCISFDMRHSVSLYAVSNNSMKQLIIGAYASGSYFNAFGSIWCSVCSFWCLTYNLHDWSWIFSLFTLPFSHVLLSRAATIHVQKQISYYIIQCCMHYSSFYFLSLKLSLLSLWEGIQM